MIFETMNALDIEYEDEQFDLIFDKETRAFNWRRL